MTPTPDSAAPQGGVRTVSVDVRQRLERIANTGAHPGSNRNMMLTAYDADVILATLARSTDVPAGCVMVPVEPTKEMLRAVDGEDDDKFVARGRAHSAWSAMIAAASADRSPK